MPYPKDVFLASLNRCCSRNEFIASFYQRLMASSDDIRKRFRFTDMERQVALLRESLRICAAAVDGDSDGLAAVTALGRSHDKYHHNIRPEWYPLWLDSLCATAAEYDSFWTADIESAWRTTLQHVINHIASKYDV